MAGQEVLDVGCGIGGPSVELVKTFNAKRVVGIDIEQSNLQRARKLVSAAALDDRISFLHVPPGVLPFDDGAFDIVFSKDALVEVRDKGALLAEAFRVLRPGGWLMRSDWLRADGPVSARLQEWIDFSASGELPHTFHLWSLGEMARSLEALGFVHVEVDNRNAWYREEARRKLSLKQRDYWPQFVALRGEKDALDSVWFHHAMIAVLDRGDFCPANFRARKPDRS